MTHVAYVHLKDELFKYVFASGKIVVAVDDRNLSAQFANLPGLGGGLGMTKRL